jgi:hypothetical protein
MIKKTMIRVSKPGTTTRSKRQVSRTTTPRSIGMGLIGLRSKENINKSLEDYRNSSKKINKRLK